MKGFLRLLCSVLLVVLLCGFTLWRQQMLPDLTAIGDSLQSTADRLEQTADAIGGIVGAVTTRPVDNSAGSGGTPLYRDYDLNEALPEGLEGLVTGAYETLQPTIDLSAYGYTVEQVRNALARIQYAHPEYFYVDSQYSMSYDQATGIATTVEVSYAYDVASIPAMRETYETALDEVVSGVNPTWSDFDKALYLHDYFVRNYTYDYTYSIHDAYTLFTQKTGVCQAYMLGLIAAGERVGLHVLPVTSNAMNHAWNMIQIDGQWYHADLTWDDSTKSPAGMSYRYFLHSDSSFVAIDAAAPEQGHHSWNAPYEATDTRYDALSFRAAGAAVVKLGDTYYCILPEAGRRGECYGAIYAGGDVNALQKLWEIGGVWQGEQPGTFYTACFSGLAAHGDKLLYHNANSVYLLDPDAAALSPRFLGIVPLEEGKELYGIAAMEGNILTLWVANDPNAAANGEGAAMALTLSAA